MGLDLTQDQITHLFDETEKMRVKLDQMYTCINDTKTDLAVVKSRVDTVHEQLNNGFPARLRRTEYLVLASALLVAADKGPSILSQVIGIIVK